jgi:hypothetical protein
VSVSRLIKAGSVYAGVAVFQGLPVLAYDVGETVQIAQLDGTVIWTSPAAAGEGSLQWVRCAASATVVEAVAMGNTTGHAYHFTASTVTDLGVTWGAPIAMEHFGGQFLLAIQRTGTTYDLGPVGGFVTLGMALTSQGFIDMIGGVPIRTDDQFSRAVGPWQLARWMERTPVVAGQWQNQNGAAVVFTDRALALTPIPEEAFEVQLALVPLASYPDGTTDVQIAVAARTPIGAQLAVDLGPYRVLLGAGPGPPPPPGGTTPATASPGAPFVKPPPPKPRRVYPHVDEIKDWPALQSTRLLWDRVWDVTEQLQTAQTTIDELRATNQTLEANIAGVDRTAKQALVASQAPTEGGTTIVGEGTGPTPTPPDGGDSGSGQEGCAAAGATGHDTGGLLTAVRVGQIVCGTGNEFSALKNPTATLDEREANAVELLRRMIWHLRLAGFTAGRQQNPSGAISKDKLTVVVESTLRAYDVFFDFDNFEQALGTQMLETAPANLVDDAGIPD